MIAAILKEHGGIYFSDINMPQISDDEVMIKVHVCGVCTSDLGAWRNGLGQEIILGHEVVGVVCKTGASVKDLSVGDRVTGSIPNGYSEYTKTKASSLIKLPGSLSDVEGLVEPIVCLLSGIERVGPVRGKRIAVIGAGYMGLNLISILKGIGCGELTAIDPKVSVHEMTIEAGADKVLTSDENAGTYPLVFEVSGSAAGIQMSGRLCEQYGKLVMVGYHPYHCEIDLALWASKAIEIIMSFEYRHDKQLEYMRKAIGMTQSGDLMGEKLFTHRFPFTELDTAFKESSLKKEGFIKAYVNIAK
jgi:Zn-dependent alcohol dehydrogenases